MTVAECMEILGATKSKDGGQWGGYHVTVPHMEGIVGMPWVILTKDGESRISTPEESIDYLDYSSPSIEYPVNTRYSDI